MEFFYRNSAETQKLLDNQITSLSQEIDSLEREFQEHQKNKIHQDDEIGDCYDKAVTLIDWYGKHSDLYNRLILCREKKSAAMVKRHPRALNPRCFGGFRMRARYLAADLVHFLLRCVLFLFWVAMFCGLSVMTTCAVAAGICYFYQCADEPQQKLLCHQLMQHLSVGSHFIRERIPALSTSLSGGLSRGGTPWM